MFLKNFSTFDFVATNPTALARMLGARIAELRASVGLTQEKLAWEAGLNSKGFLSRIESGKRVPSLSTLEQLARRLGVEVRDLFIFPDRGEIDQAMERIRREPPEFSQRVVKLRAKVRPK